MLGSKAGVEPAKVVQVLSGGLAGNRILELKGKGMIEHAFPRQDDCSCRRAGGGADGQGL